MPIDYSRAKIYKIWSPSNPELVYIGSTCEPTLARRMAGHRSNYRLYLNGKYGYVTSFKVLQYDDARIDLIESIECKCKDELRQIEGKYIEEIDCVNKLIAGRSKKQYRQDNREKLRETNKQYYENNKEKVRERHKKYYENNKEKVREYGKQYREDNREKERERSKKYYENNREKIKTKASIKITCECSSTIRKDSLARHRRTKKHINYIKSKSSN